ncbi:MAG: hypothetical protein ICV65_07000 [Flavisolibacter sp.]|nr:hypothetical protein [Flavisolibacter sp.]
MNILFSLLASVFFLFCANAKERNYTGSTPAGTIVRSFLGIAFTDSVDFIRWKLNVQDGRYSLKCNYGIGKPNTNGFINDGKWINLEGRLEKKQNKYLLQRDNKILKMIEVNSNLLHLLDKHNNLLVGNDGWSYTLNSETPQVNDQLNLLSKQTKLKDSMTFQGRTPCLPFAYEKQSSNCYKLKWSVVFYTDPKTNMPTTYYLRGTVVDHERKSGIWNINKGKDGRIIYRLQSANNEVLQLVVLDENIIVFTDKQGNLLAGNEDFSYTLNRK